KRANALKNIVIPDLEEQIHYITGYLEEKERDEFTTLKVVKGRK
ncbi:MAG: V-type ATP synthase subunit D, partial [Clostridiales bacterium]|nr:V-type ATP synthase subunit D [Clostridiales bacterium]